MTSAVSSPRSPDLVGEDLKAAYKLTAKQARHAALSAAKAKAAAALVKTDDNPDGYDSAKFGSAFKECEASVLRRDVLKTGKRIDGRDVDRVRPIVAEVGILPAPTARPCSPAARTQALVVATLGTGDDEQFNRRPGRHLQGKASCCTTTSRPIAWARLAA